MDQNSKVTEWRDKSGEDNHATQSVPSRRLTYLESDPLADDKSSLQSLSNLGTIGLDIPSFSIKEVFMVLYYDDSTDDDFDQYNIILSSTGNYGKHRIMGVKNTDDLSDSNTWSLNSQTFKNGSSLSSNEVLPLPNSVMRFVSNSVIDEQRFLFSGTYSGASDRGWKGSVCEIIALPDSPSSADVEKIEGYLAHKWGLEGDLPSNHNFKSSAPTEIIDPEDHPYSLSMLNACESGGQFFYETALEVRMTAPIFSTDDFFKAGGEVRIFGTNDPTPSPVEPNSAIPNDVSSIDWMSYFSGVSEIVYNDSTSFSIRENNDFSTILPQVDQEFYSFKYYFIKDGLVVHSGNCEFFVDRPTCVEPTTTTPPTTTLDPSIPTTTLDPSIPTTTRDPNPPITPEQPHASISYAVSDCNQYYENGVLSPQKTRLWVRVFLGLNRQWLAYARHLWEQDGKPSGEYYNYVETHSALNQELDFRIWFTSQGFGNYDVNEVIDLSSSDEVNPKYTTLYGLNGGELIGYTFDYFYDIPMDASIHQNQQWFMVTTKWVNDSSSQDILSNSLTGICETSTTSFPTTYPPTTTCPPAKYDVGDVFYDSSGMYEIISQGFWYSTCTPQYDAIFYDYLNGYDHCSEMGISGSNVYAMGDSDFDAMFSLSHAKQQGWVNCATTSSPTTTSSTTSVPQGFQVGDYTQWYGVSVQIVGVNGDGTYNINNNGSISYSISASSLGTDIGGNPI